LVLSCLFSSVAMLPSSLSHLLPTFTAFGSSYILLFHSSCCPYTWHSGFFTLSLLFCCSVLMFLHWLLLVHLIIALCVLLFATLFLRTGYSLLASSISYMLARYPSSCCSRPSCPNGTSSCLLIGLLPFVKRLLALSSSFNSAFGHIVIFSVLALLVVPYIAYCSCSATWLPEQPKGALPFFLPLITACNRSLFCCSVTIGSSC
jgi:hypothetical protein